MPRIFFLYIFTSGVGFLAGVIQWSPSFKTPSFKTHPFFKTCFKKNFFHYKCKITPLLQFPLFKDPLFIILGGLNRGGPLYCTAVCPDWTSLKKILKNFQGYHTLFTCSCLLALNRILQSETDSLGLLRKTSLNHRNHSLTNYCLKSQKSRPHKLLP